MAYYSADILEEELKNRVAHDWFSKFDNAKILGKVDFCICVGELNLIWGEAKRGTSHDIYESFVQLILTIGKERTFDDYMPPAYLCAFDAEKIAFIEYSNVLDIFYQNDFNWNVPPSNHKTKEFKQLKDRVIDVLEREKYLYNYENDEDELLEFIDSLELGRKDVQVQIDKNNFTHIYHKWRAKVMPSIAVNWEKARKREVVSADFYIADVISESNETILDNLKVLLKKDHYEFDKEEGDDGIFTFKSTNFKDGGKAHSEFWKIYKRPPREVYQDYIIERRDLLVPQDIRERKGSFFTPRKWVELSQNALAEELGINWQEEYYVWDCCAGTGNLLSGLTEAHRVYASTIDSADVGVMQELSANKTLNLFSDHIFQFDFLNDSFDKLPKPLYDIISDEEKRKKLIIYINPPYAEAGNRRQTTGTGKNKGGVATENEVYKKYKDEIGSASNEIFALFLYRIYREITGCTIANFATLKILMGSNFKKFLGAFQPQLHKLFILPANSFDNVSGQFPIGFYIWNSTHKTLFRRITGKVYGHNAKYIKRKVIRDLSKRRKLNEWLRSFQAPAGQMGMLMADAPDFQNQGHVAFVSSKTKGHWIFAPVSIDNLLPYTIYFSVRHCIRRTWLNNNDQFLEPKQTWIEDCEFPTNCLTFALFHSKNYIRSADCTNHWIPFKEREVGAHNDYKSHLLLDYLEGKSTTTTNEKIFKHKQPTPQKITFSPEAQAVMDRAKDLYIYYHQQENANTDASFYDIRLYFQGTDAKGRMNPSSNNNTYNDLLKRLREAQKILADKIAKKVYEHGFLEE